MRIEAGVFDMDGVLLDSEPLHFAILNQVLAAEQRRLSPAENDEFLGWTTQATFDVLVPRLRLSQPAAVYIERYEAALLRALAEPQTPAPGVLALLDTLQQLGLRLAVASSSQRSWID